MPTMPCQTVVMRSLLAHRHDLFFKVYMGNYAELFPAEIGDHDSKQSCIFPVTKAVTKRNTSGESITMDLKTFARVSLIRPFGRHMPVGPTGTQFSAVYSCHMLAEHTVLAGFQFDPGGYLSRGFVFDPRGFTYDLRDFTQLLTFLRAARDVMISDGEQSVKYFLRDASDIHVVDMSGFSGQSHFRQKGSDKNHTGLSPLGITVIRGFVLTSDQVRHQGTTIIGLRIGTYFSHGFSVYSCVFGAIRSSSDSPSTTRGTLCIGYVDSSTWYSSYTVHVGISIPTVATHRLHPSYSIYVESTIIPTRPTYQGLSPPVRATYLPIADSFLKTFHKRSPHIFP